MSNRRVDGTPAQGGRAAVCDFRPFFAETATAGCLGPLCGPRNSAGAPPLQPHEVWSPTCWALPFNSSRPAWCEVDRIILPVPWPGHRYRTRYLSPHLCHPEVLSIYGCAISGCGAAVCGNVTAIGEACWWWWWLETGHRAGEPAQRGALLSCVAHGRGSAAGRGRRHSSAIRYVASPRPNPR